MYGNTESVETRFVHTSAKDVYNGASDKTEAVPPLVNNEGYSRVSLIPSTCPAEHVEYVVHCKCKFCEKRLNNDVSNLMMCPTCKNIYHKRCVNPFFICSTKPTECAVCKTLCLKFIKESHIPTNTQEFINIMSTKKTQYFPSICARLRSAARIIHLLHYFRLFYNDYCNETVSLKSFDEFLDNLHWCLNIKVTVFGEEKLDSATKMYVGNHSGEHDALIIPRYIKSGVLASVATQKTLIGRMMIRYTDVLLIERGKSHDTVDLMKDFLGSDDHPNLFVFPTGIFDQQDTISKFRSGAFATGYPVQPIITKFSKDISSMSISHILMLDSLEVEIHILDTIYNNRNLNAKEFAEHVRQEMSKYDTKYGKLSLSNVDSHDARD